MNGILNENVIVKAYKFDGPLNQKNRLYNRCLY